MRQVALPALILDTSDTSAPVQVKGSFIVAIQTDAAFEGAALEAEVSYDDATTWAPVLDDAGAAVSIVATASQTIRLDASEWCFADLIRFVSDAAQAAGNTTLTVVVLAD